MSSTATPPLNLCTVNSESKRIIKAHSRHFLALSVLFLLPLSFSIVVYPTLQQLLLDSTQNQPPLSLRLIRSFNDSTSTVDKQPLFLPLAYTLFGYVFSLCAVGSITYSVFHGFYGRPVKLLPAIRSIFTSFLPLLVTTIVSQIIVSGVVLVFAAFLFLIVKLVNSIGLVQFDYSSPNFMGLALVLSVALLCAVVHLQVNWTLASVVVVVESNWGFKPLKRSAELIKGYRMVALSLCLYYSLLTGVVIWCCNMALSTYLGSNNISSDGWKSWGFVLQIVFTSTVLTVFFLQYMAANTVLYMHCKATHGELATEIAEEFAKDYVSLPFDDGKVPHLVSVAYAT